MRRIISNFEFLILNKFLNFRILKLIRNSKLETRNFHSGFTLIELMVTLAIFTVMTGIVLANYPSFNTKIARDILVQNIALSIREAQVSGTSVRTSGGTIATAYGVHYPNQLTGPQSYYFFADNDSNNVYDTSVTPLDEIVTTYAIPPGKNRILYLCGNYYYQQTNGIVTTRTDCDEPTNANKDLTIAFHRPNPEAIIMGTLKEGIPQCGASSDETTQYDSITGLCTYTNVAIFVGDGTGSYRKIVIRNTGQIATE